MKLTESKLRQIIKEEILSESDNKEKYFVLYRDIDRRSGGNVVVVNYKFFRNASMPEFSFTLPVKYANEFENDLSDIIEDIRALGKKYSKYSTV